jgi:hypothetical protein
MKKARITKILMFDVSPSAADFWFDAANLVLLVGALLIVLGTFGVYKFGGIKEHFSDVRLSENETLAAQAGTAAEIAKQGAAQANATAAQANERAAELENEAEQARLETQKLKAEMAWRTITPQQHDIIVSMLRGHQIEVWTYWVGTDPEATLYRNDIDKTLTDAGVKTKYFSGWQMALGLQLTNIPGPEHDLLIKAFRAAGINLESVPPPSSGVAGLAIIVGTKPQPF